MHMRYYLVLIFFEFVPCTISLLLAERTTPSVLHTRIHRRPYETNRISSRTSTATLSETLENAETLYYVETALGTPAQDVRLHIDTGSSDLWTNTPSSSFCSQSIQPCADAGTYTANHSSTYQYLNSIFSIEYVDGSNASGDYARDSLTFAELVLPDVQFGIGYSSSTSEGVLGLGYMASEAQVLSGAEAAYPNLPQLLVNRNVTQANAYSLWLNDLNASTGSILFGGVNTAKFRGSLATLPVIPENNEYNALIIALTDLGFNGTAGSIANDRAIPVVLDAGSAISYLPLDIAEKIIQTFNGTFGPNHSPAAVDCSLASQLTTIDFTFSSSAATISVPLKELVFQNGQVGTEPICTFGIAPSSGGVSVLGDTFLRSAYVVFDLGRNEISLAQTDFGSTTPDHILEIAPPPATVPDAKAVISPVATISSSETGSLANPTTQVSAVSPFATTLGATGCIILAAVIALVSSA